jgi:hypothetical protein
LNASNLTSGGGAVPAKLWLFKAGINRDPVPSTPSSSHRAAEPFLPSSGYSKPVLIDIQLFNTSNPASGAL